MSNPFKKFIQQGDSGAKKKERIRQEKKKVRKETQEYFEKKKQEAREARAHGAGYKPEGIRDKAQGTRHKEQATSYKSKVVSNKRSETAHKASVSTVGGRGNVERGTKSREEGTGKKVDIRSKVQKAAGQPQTTTQKPETGSMPLNKFIAHAGICSRRDAAELVKAGKVMVNGENITEPGHKVTDKDDIKVNGKKLHLRRNLVYILLNKPKDYITTTDDPQGRKTVLDIVRNATTERVYPIGRLDRNTTGVLLLTNDGELAQKLSHPSYEIKKIYEVKLDKPLVKKDFETIVNGVALEDGFIAPDTLAYADPKDKSVIGIEIHSGRNRIVRRIFEHIGYDVRNLDRVMYANLTKKNVERGKWRFLTEKEVRLLKYLNASYTKNKPATRG